MHTIFHCGSSPFDRFVEAKVIWQIGLAKFSIFPSRPSTQKVILVETHHRRILNEFRTEERGETLDEVTLTTLCPQSHKPPPQCLHVA
jgi:hypothetical protein